MIITSLVYGLKRDKKLLNRAKGETLSHVTTNIHVALNSVSPEQFFSRAEVLSSCCKIPNNKKLKFIIKILQGNREDLLMGESGKRCSTLAFSKNLGTYQDVLLTVCN